MAVYTINSTNGGGQVQSNNATYSTARAGGTLATSTTALQIGQNTGFFCWEAFTSFDTSVLPDDAVIIDATLQLRISTDTSTTDFTIEARQKSWLSSGLTTADWVAGASLSGSTLLASLATSGISATGQLYALTSNGSALISAISPTGVLEIMLCSDRHGAGTQPTGNERVDLGTSTSVHVLTVTTQDPQLRIVGSSQRW